MPPEKTTVDNALSSWPIIGPSVLFVLTAAGTFWAKLSGKASREELATAIKDSRAELVTGLQGVYSRINEIDTKQQKRIDDFMRHNEDQRTELERYISDKLREHANIPNKRKDD